MVADSRGVIIFDVDGTLFDTMPGIFDALEDVFKHFNVGRFDRSDGKKYIGPPIKESLVRYNGMTEEMAEIATAYYRKVYADSYIVNSKPYGDVREILCDLSSEGFSIAIATMKTRHQIDRLFKISDLDKGLFGVIETALDDGGLSKAGMISKICERYSGTRSVIMVGDTDGDLRAADEAGVGFVGVTYGYGFEPNEDNGFLAANSVREVYGTIKKLSQEEA